MRLPFAPPMRSNSSRALQLEAANAAAKRSGERGRQNGGQKLQQDSVANCA
jgi:hypothetical protein